MYGCESWTVKKAERWRIDAFELWCWRRLLRVPWTARRSNQPILKEISPGISLEGMMLKLKLQYFGHLMQRVDSLERLWCWEGLGAGGEGDDRGWDGWMASVTRWTWVWVNSGSWWWTGRPGVLRFMASKKSDTTEWLNWTELNWTPWKESYDQPRLHIKKAETVLCQQSMSRLWFFPVVMDGCESCTRNKAEHQRIDAFKLFCRRLLKVPGQQGDQTNQSQRKSTLNIHWNNWC